MDAVKLMGSLPGDIELPADLAELQLVFVAKSRHKSRPLLARMIAALAEDRYDVTNQNFVACAEHALTTLVPRYLGFS